MPFRHGIFVSEPATGARPILPASLAVIGLVATAPDADAAYFPLNGPALVTNPRAALAKAGTQGTLAKALAAICDQTTPVIVVVRVAPGVAAGETSVEEATDINVIGGVNGNGRYTGLQALLAAKAKFGVQPRIIGCPGLDTQPVTAAMVAVAKKLRGFCYARCNGAEPVAPSEAIAYRDEFADRELMLIYPDFSGWEGQAIAVALGTRARIDEETGWHKTLSNVPVLGVTGMSRDIYFDLSDPSTPAAELNAAPVTTLVHQNGYRFWGNRTCSDDERYAFETSVRTLHALQDELIKGLAWAVDKAVTPRLVRDILDSANARFRTLKAQGRIIGAEAYMDPALNQADQLALGKAQIDIDFTPCPPLEDLGLNMQITDRFLLNFTEQVAAV
jgi:hypothetical protein